MLDSGKKRICKTKYVKQNFQKYERAHSKLLFHFIVNCERKLYCERKEVALQVFYIRL